MGGRVGNAARFFVGPDSDPDRYELIENLGGGAEAEVWRATLRAVGDGVDGELDVAIKIFRGGPTGSAEPPLPPPPPPSSTAATQPLDHGRQRVQDWERRTRLLWQFNHPGIVQLRESFIGPPMHPSGRVRTEPELACRFVVMDFIDAPRLLDWLPLNADADLTQRLHVLRSVAAGLDAMHASNDGGGFAHGDVKPANILVPAQRQGVLVDFSLMRMAGGPTLATRPYAAPELFAGSPATPASDRFAFFATLFEVATLQVPPLRPDGAGPDVVQLHRMLLDSPQTANRPRLIEVIINGVSADPAERPERLLTALDGTVTSTYLNSADLAAAASAGSAGETRVLSAPAAAGPPGPDGPSSGRRRRRGGRVAAIVVGIVAVLALAAGALYLAGFFDTDPGETNADLGNTASDPGNTVPDADEVSDGDAPGDSPSTPSNDEPSETPTDRETSPAVTPMPGLVGSSIAEARRELSSLGLPAPTIIEVLDEETPNGQVLAQAPEPGTPDPGEPELSVATAPVERYMFEMNPITDGIEEGPVSISGETYPRSFQAALSYGAAPWSREWDLGRDFRVLRATIGLEDSSAIADAEVQFEVRTDGTTIFNERLFLGEARLVELDVAGALRVEISATVLTDGGFTYQAHAAFGDPVLLGLPSEVPAEQEDT